MTHLVFFVDVRSVFQQQFDHRLVSIPRGKMKRSQRKLWKTGRNDAVKKAILMMVFYEISLESAKVHYGKCGSGLLVDTYCRRNKR